MENVRETQPTKETEPVQQEKETAAITPGQMRVIKRNGSVVPYDQETIVALATPPGVGALSVLRLSGESLVLFYKQLTFLQL